MRPPDFVLDEVEELQQHNAEKDVDNLIEAIEKSNKLTLCLASLEIITKVLFAEGLRICDLPKSLPWLEKYNEACKLDGEEKAIEIMAALNSHQPILQRMP